MIDAMRPHFGDVSDANIINIGKVNQNILRYLVEICV